MKSIYSFIMIAVAACFAGCTDNPSEPNVVVQKLVLSVNDTEIEVGDTVTFTTELDGVDKTSSSVFYRSSSAGNEQLDGNTFNPVEAGNYTFFAICSGIKSNSVQVSVTGGDTPDVTKKLALTASKDEMVADGEDFVSFTVTLDADEITADYVIYYTLDGDATPIDGNQFTTSVAGTYTFYVTHDTFKSDNITITAVEPNTPEPPQPDDKPITLSATATMLRANGVDFIQFSVEQEGRDVTAESTVYVDGGRLNGYKFSTTNAGSYVVYAEKGSVKSNEITITAEEVTQTGTSIVFADGVTLTSGWYDVNKKGMGANGDINMCWAAASANMIQWWQDRYVAAGNTLPATAVTGPGTKTYDKFGAYELALMEVYHSEWDNSKGGHSEEAIPWYFEGKLYGGEHASSGSQAYPKSDGGYWKNVWSSIEPYIYRGYKHDIFASEYGQMYTYCYNNYYLWGDGSTLEGTERLSYFTNLVVQSIDRGVASLTISLSSNIASLHHAVTIWGYEIDNATGLLTRIWITDSDDLVSEPKQQLLNEYRVSIGEGRSHIQLTGDTRYGSAWIVSIHPFSGYGSAGK